MNVFGTTHRYQPNDPCRYMQEVRNHPKFEALVRELQPFKHTKVRLPLTDNPVILTHWDMAFQAIDALEAELGGSAMAEARNLLIDIHTDVEVGDRASH